MLTRSDFETANAAKIRSCIREFDAEVAKCCENLHESCRDRGVFRIFLLNTAKKQKILEFLQKDRML